MTSTKADLKQTIVRECTTDSLLLNALHRPSRVECIPDGYLCPRDSVRVDYVFVAMEPSLKGPHPFQGQEASGSRPNFASSRRDFVLHLFIRRHLPKGSYYITDIAKGAMLTSHASESYIGRWIRWYPVLIDELRMIVHTKTRLFALGDEVFSAVHYSNTQARLSLESAVKKLTHYANRFPKASKPLLREIEQEYENFDMKTFTGEVLRDAGYDRRSILEVSNNIRSLNGTDKALLACWKEQLAYG